MKYQDSYMTQESGNTNLLIFEGAIENFTNYLLDIAVYQNSINLSRSVVITSHISNELINVIKNFDFIEISDIKVPNEYKVFFRQKLNILESFRRIFLSQFYFQKRAVTLLNKYKPQIIYIQKGNYGEVPYIVELAKRKKILSVAIQSSYCSFGLYDKLDKFIYKNKTKKIINKLIPLFYYYIKIYNNIIKFLYGVRCLEERNNRGNVDMFFVDNDKFKYFYQKFGQRMNSIYSVGVPEDDILYRQQRNYNYENIVLILGNGPAIWLNVSKEYYINKLNNLVNLLINSGIKLKIKLHPADDVKNYLEIKNFTENLTNENIYKLVADAGLVITNGGSSTRYPSLLGKLCIVVSLDSIIAKESSIFFEVPLIENLDDLKSHLDNPKIKNGKIIVDGNAVKRISKKVFENELYTSISTKFKG